MPENDENTPKKNIYGEREKDIQNNDPNRNIQGTPKDQDNYGQRRNERGEPEK
jgi:hypothetical protein